VADNKTSIVITAEDRASAALRSISKSFDGIIGTAGKVTGAFTALTGLSFGGAAAGLGALVKSTADAQDSMLKLSQKAGISVESLSGLGYAAKLAGADTEALVKASKTLSQNIVDASRNANESTTIFGGMGIAVKDAAGNLRATDQVLLDVADKFAGMEDGANKSALAVKLFGKSGLDLIPFLNQGKAGIGDLTKEAERLGLVMSTEAAIASEKFNDNLERVGQAAEGVKLSIGNAALPLLNELVQQMTDAATSSDSLAGSLRNLFSQSNIEEWAEKGAYALAFVADAGKGVVATFQALGTTVGAAIAQVEAALSGDFAGVASIGAAWQEQLADVFDYEQTRGQVEKFFDEYRRSARINGEKVVFETAEQARAAQKAWDESYAGMKAASKGFVEFDEKQLAAQESIRKRYTEEEKRRTLGEYQYKKQLIEEKYNAELNAIRGAQDAGMLEVEIKKRMADEIIALERSMSQAAVIGEQTALDAAAQSAAARVQIESQAAQQVATAWDQANTVKAGAVDRNGMKTIFNTNSESDKWFRGEVDIFGNSTAGSIGALGNAYTTDGKKLTIQEEIAILNGADIGPRLSGMQRALHHFATGGSFMVGGSGGTDSQLVAFKASPDERVTIETPEQQRRGSPTININVNGGSPAAIIAAIKQALRVDPNLLSTGMARAG
jgi:hypothetical protein